MANKGSFLTTGQSLNAGDYLVAANAQYFAIMQSDGNFVIYHGSDPAHQGTPIWATNTVDIRQYMGFSAVMQSDGNFVLYYGTGYGNTGGARWASNTPQAQGRYFATLRNDGHLVLSHGTPTTPGDVYWDNQVGVVTPQLTILSGNNQTQLRLEPTPGQPAIANFGPLSVRLTYRPDNIGNPLSGKQVNWSVSGHPATMIVQLASTTTTTDSNGNATLNSLQASYGDGTFTVVASYGSASVTFKLTVRGEILTAGQYLSSCTDDYLVSANGLYFAIMQRDGNFVLYHATSTQPPNPDWSRPYWASNTGGIGGQPSGQYVAIMQGDGNFVLYHGCDPTAATNAYWASNTYQAPSLYFAIMQRDGNFVLYSGTPPNNGPAYWATNTVAGVGLKLAILSGNNQTQPRRTTEPYAGEGVFGPLSVRVTDNIGNPKSGEPVNWDAQWPVSLFGSIATTTDANGIATLIGVSIDYVGSFTVVATVPYNASVTFNLTVSS